MKPGDVVVLISGGEPMTVTELEGEFARCQWFEENGGWKTGLFLLSSLEQYKNGGGGVVELRI
jgi:uncharacterized protein YodC (DUF2158 family)